MKPSTFVLRQSDNALVMIEGPEMKRPKESDFKIVGGIGNPRIGVTHEEYYRAMEIYQQALTQAITNGIKVADEKAIERLIVKAYPELIGTAVKHDTVYTLEVDMEVKTEWKFCLDSQWRLMKQGVVLGEGDETRQVATFGENERGTKTQNMEQQMEVKRALDAPANYSLQECLAELKAGRPAQNQIWLDEKIKELNVPKQEPKQEGEIDKLIRSIHVDRANFEHIAKTGNINGTLLSELRRILTPAEPKEDQGELTDGEIIKWFRSQKFQTERGEQEYTMIFEIDLPKIIRAFIHRK